MLQSYKQHIASYYTGGQTKTIDIDALLSFTPLTSAKLVFYNVDGNVGSFNIKIYNWLALGDGDDPLHNGDFSFILNGVDGVTLPAGSRYAFVLDGSIDDNLSIYQIVIHNNSGSIMPFHFIIEGLVDAAVEVTVPV